MIFIKSITTDPSRLAFIFNASPELMSISNKSPVYVQKTYYSHVYKLNFLNLYEIANNRNEIYYIVLWEKN